MQNIRGITRKVEGPAEEAQASHLKSPTRKRNGFFLETLSYDPYLAAKRRYLDGVKILMRSGALIFGQQEHLVETEISLNDKVIRGGNFQRWEPRHLVQ